MSCLRPFHEAALMTTPPLYQHISPSFVPIDPAGSSLSTVLYASSVGFISSVSVCKAGPVDYQTTEYISTDVAIV
jgi:hypothetical protein